jgi:hypothetical protein
LIVDMATVTRESRRLWLVLAGAATGGTAGTTADAAIGGGLGWIGAASDAWSQIRGR